LLKKFDPNHRVLFLIWVAFLARGTFYSVQQPSWEGFDEWAHFARIQFLFDNHRSPTRNDPISDEIKLSLLSVPLSAHAVIDIAGAVTHDQYWKIPRAEANLKALQLKQYEAQQPPLYYWLSVIPYAALESSSLPTRVLAIRLFSVVIASTTAPLAYALARVLMPLERFALLVPLLIASLPGLSVNICRVGNECLAIPLTSAVLLVMLKARHPKLLGTVLGATLLTKAYALAFLPLIPTMAILRLWTWRKVFTSVALAVLISGWWYWGAFTTTGALSGEQIDAAATHFTLSQKLQAARSINWSATIDTFLFTHIWVGGWSFLVVRSWMYRVVESIALVAAVGLVILAWRRKFTSKLVLTSAMYILLCAGLAYHAVTMSLVRNTPATMGWYLYACIIAEVSLLTWGLIGLAGAHAAVRALAAIACLAIALDVYTVHFVLTSYYTGQIAHSATGRLEAFPAAAFLKFDVVSEIVKRLAVNESHLIGPAMILGSWIGYALGTGWLLVTALRFIGIQISKPPVPVEGSNSSP